MLLLPLVFFELYLCAAFLPVGWQHTINDTIPDICPKSHDRTPKTHPLLSQEIEQLLHEHVGLRIALYAITIALLAVNTWLIYLIWRLFLAAQRQSENHRI